MKFSNKPSPPPKLNTVPIINIVFLLLIFFMIQGVLKKADIIPIEAPISKSGKLIKDKQVELLLGDGVIILQNDFIDKANLADKINNLVLNSEKLKVHLKADKNINAHELLDILQIMRNSGVQDISLITETPY